MRPTGCSAGARPEPGTPWRLRRRRGLRRAGRGRRRRRRRGRRWRRRAEGARGAQGGREVQGHRVQVGRLDAADGLRLLRPGAVGLREGRDPDPARHRRAVRRRQRHEGRPRRPQARRPRLLRHAGQHLPRRHLDGRRRVPARAEDGRRRQGREPEGVLLLPAFAGGRRFDEATGAAAAAAPARPRRGRGRGARAPAIDPKAVAEAQAAVARDAAEVNRQGSGLFMAVKAQEARAPRDRPVHEGDRSQGGRTRRAAAAAAAAAAAPAADAAAVPATPAAAPPAEPADPGRAPTPARRSSSPPTSPTTTRATTRRRTRSRSGWPSRPTSTASRPSCRSWPRS